VYNVGHAGLEGDSPRWPHETENTGGLAKLSRKFTDWPDGPGIKKEIKRMPNGVLGIDDITSLPRSYLESELRRRKSSYFAEQIKLKDSGDSGREHRSPQSNGKS
jgi:hypothetical protein